MEQIDYAVVIRTTGNAHEKYQRLLDSVNALVPAPKEVIVVLPEGYALPDEKLGYESFRYAPKGMLSQRLAGVRCCSTAYALLCDDDVCFPSDFVRKLYEPIKAGLGVFSAAPLYSFLPETGIRAVFDCVRGAACPTVWHRDRYVSVLRTTGYSYNRHLNEKKKYYETQSLPWTCFFATVKDFVSLQLEDENWIDAHGYAAMDDQLMFYKAWLRIKKTIVVSNAEYTHLDAKTSVKGSSKAALYSLRYNRYVFWHRFLYSQEKTGIGRLWCKIAFGYRLCWEKAYDWLNFRRSRITEEEYAVIRKGWTEGRAFTESAEYTNLPPVV